MPDFDRSLTTMFQAGGPTKKRAERVHAILGKLGGELDPFLGLSLTNHGESRIKHCLKYDLGDGWRIITIQDDKACWFCFVGNHSDADDWIRTHSGLEVVRGEHGDAITTYRSLDVEDGRIRRVSDYGPGTLLDRLDPAQQDELMTGVPPSLVGKLFSLTTATDDSALSRLCSQLSDIEKGVLLYDVLCLLVAGDVQSAERRLALAAGRMRSVADLSPEEMMEVREGNELRRIAVGSEAHKAWLERLAAEAPFIEWLLYLHPEQEAIVREDFDGPAQLSGVSGSGKTCIAVHRATRLAKEGGQVLILTLNRSLAGLIRMLVEQAALDPIVRARIEVSSFFELCQRLLKEYEPQNEKLYWDVTRGRLNEHIDEIFREYYRCWNNNSDASVLQPVHKTMIARNVSAEGYLREEFDWVRSALPAENREKYLGIERSGRRFPIPEDRRQLILHGLAGWERKMAAIGVIDYLGLTTALSRHFDQLKATYSHVIVDEAQDFGTAELRIVRRLVDTSANDILLCGDIAQHVLPKHRDLETAGIAIGKRARRIKRNYRNSREILKAAHEILMQNLDETQLDSSDLEILDPELANRSSPYPSVLRADSLLDEIAYARSLLAHHLQHRPDHRCCIAFAGYSFREVQLFAITHGLPSLDGSGQPNDSRLVMADLEQTKGYEFNIMVVVNCSAGVLPPADAPPEEAFRYGCRLYVAMTRARDELYLSYAGNPSPWLDTAKSHLHFMEWSEVMDMDPALRGNTPPRLGETQEESDAAALGLDGRAFLYTRWATGLSVEAQDKLEQLVDGRGMVSDGRRVRWRTMGALREDLDRQPHARSLLGPKVQVEVREVLSRIPQV